MMPGVSERLPVVAQRRRTCVTPTCLRPLPKGEKGRVCSTCRARRRGTQPRVHGPCLCGCGRPARTLSGLALRCYNNLHHRRRTLRRVLRAALGADYPAGYLGRALAAPTPPAPVLAFVAHLFMAIEEGRLALYPIRRRTPKPKEDQPWTHPRKCCSVG